MPRSMNLLCTLVTLVVFLGLTTPVVAGPVPTPATPTPATATPTAVPTPEPGCTTKWPVITIFTIGKSNDPLPNALVSHAITGNIVRPEKLSDKSHRITVCRNTFVKAVITVPGGFCAINTATDTLDCDRDCHVCEGVVSSRERYTSRNSTGSDTDRMEIVPNVPK